MMGENVRLIIVGVGLVGKRHVAAIGQVSGVELMAVVDTSPQSKEYARRHGITHIESLALALESLKPDGVILSTPTPMHIDQASLCVEHGVPVLVEKPLATSADDAEKLVSFAQKANVPLLVGHHRRHNPLIKQAWQLIQDGEVGDIRAVHAQCWFYKPDHYFEEAPWRGQLGAGPISVNLVHDIDLIRYLCGEVVAVSAHVAASTRGFENEEVAAAVLTFANGAIGTITVSDGIVSPWSWELTSQEYPIYPVTNQSCYHIGGSHGSLSIPDLTLWNQHGKQDWWEAISATSMPQESSDPLVNQIDHFRRVIKGYELPLVSGEEGLKTLRVLEAIENSGRRGVTIDVIA